MEISESKINREVLLPYGEKLKPLLNSSTVKATELKNILNDRGIFIAENSKEKEIPILTKILLIPSEFEKIIETQKTKDETVKRRTRSIKCDTEKSLIDILDDEIKEEQLNLPEYKSYELNCNLEVMPVLENRNSVEIDYSISREDPTKDWTNQKSKFNGKVKITKNGTDIDIEMEYTSPETQDVNNKIVSCIKRQLVDKNIVDKNEEIDIITSSKLNNKKRFEFLLNLSSDSQTGILIFKQIKNVEFSPDNSQNLVEDIKWMSERVKNMKLSGKALNEIKYLQDEQYRDCLKLSEIQSEYSYEYEGGKR